MVCHRGQRRSRLEGPGACDGDRHREGNRTGCYIEGMSEIERCVRTACLWEATARKAGNVHPFAEFDDLKYADFVRSGEAIAPVLDAYHEQPLGITILEAIRATRAVVNTNTNLGIVLLLAPLSKVERFSAQSLAQPPHPGPLPRSGGEGERRVSSRVPASGERVGVRGSSLDSD